MLKINERKLYRIIDANLNRAKEGLRVCEDICRFVLDQKDLTRKFKTLRHRLTDIVSKLQLIKVIQSRDIDKDVGKSSIAVEFKRSDISDIFYANAQRTKESIRVLEEITKLIDKKTAGNLKKIRYQMYACEKKIVERF